MSQTFHEPMSHGGLGLAEGLGLSADRPGVDLAAHTSLRENGLRHEYCFGHNQLVSLRI
jgi:hypothetical protein